MLSAMLKKSLKDLSAWAILAANLVCIISVYLDQNLFAPVFWTWFLQTLFIGGLACIRILTLKSYSTKGLSIAGFPDEPPPSFKLQVYAAIFAILPLAFFHFLYYVFASNFYRLSFPSPDEIYHLASAFFAAHLFSFFYNRKYRQTEVNLGELITLPLLRIIPTHLFIILAAIPFLLFKQVMIGYLIFAILKTIVDLLMHYLENSKSTSTSPSHKMAD